MQRIVGSKKVQAVVRRLSCIPVVRRLRLEDGQNGGSGAAASASDGDGAAAASSDATDGTAAASATGNNNNNNNSNNAKPLPKPGKKKPKKQKSFSDIDKGKGADPSLVYRCGLTVRQVFSIKQSWKAIMRDDAAFGVEMFVRLFKTNSDLQALFQGFKHIESTDELRSNEALEYHATLVMTTLDDAITHIDNYEFVRQLLHKAGASHTKFQGFVPHNFMQMRDPFLEAVRVTLGDRYTDNMETIYSIAITFILQTLMEGINEAMDNAERNRSKAGGTSVGKK